MKYPDPSSKRTKRRANRGFVSLEKSSRKHRRAANRQYGARFFNGKDHKPGEKDVCAGGPNPRAQWLYTAGGSLRYH